MRSGSDNYLTCFNQLVEESEEIDRHEDLCVFEVWGPAAGNGMTLGPSNLQLPQGMLTEVEHKNASNPTPCREELGIRLGGGEIEAGLPVQVVLGCQRRVEPEIRLKAFR